MEIPSSAWMSELEMEETHEFINQHQQTHPYYSDSMDSFSSESFKGYPNFINQPIQEATANEDQQQDYKATKSSPFAPSYGSSSKAFTISFGNFASPPQTNSHALNPKEELSLSEFIGPMDVPKRVQSTSRNRRQAQEHVLAERKRREKLAQRFISLSALLPGLKKMDKATVLEDASKYIKELQKRVKELEETQVKGKDIIQKSTVSIGRSKLSSGLGGQEDASSSDGTNILPHIYYPETEVRISGSSILVRIYCWRNSSLVLKALTEMERLRLTVVSSSILPFSNTALLITIIAQMSDDFSMTAMDLVKYLQSSLRNFL